MVSDGKKLVANAITDKGISTSETATFETMSNNISQIQTGTDTSDANATASQILSGRTAYVKGSKITGTMANRGAWNKTINSGSVTIPAGYHNGSGRVTANSSFPSNFKNLTLELRNGQSYTYNIGYKFGQNMFGFIFDYTYYASSSTYIYISCGGSNCMRISPRYRNISFQLGTTSTYGLDSLNFMTASGTTMRAEWNALTGDVTVTNCLNKDPFFYDWWIIVM